MCGIFAYTGTVFPDPDTLVAAAAGAAQRGPHGHGWAGPGIRHHQLGPLNPATVADLVVPRLVGHTRLATFGAVFNDPTGLQPVDVDRHLVVHNGNIYNASDLHPEAVTDTWAFAHRYAAHRQNGATYQEAFTATINQADTVAYVIVTLDATGTLLASRRRLPLWRHDTDTGTYLSSRPFADATPLPENELLVLPSRTE